MGLIAASIGIWPQIFKIFLVAEIADSMIVQLPIAEVTMSDQAPNYASIAAAEKDRRASCDHSVALFAARYCDA